MNKVGKKEKEKIKSSFIYCENITERNSSVYKE